ncbi:MAG: hypothetical protein V3S30_10600 [Thermoanaerobaculia bacterium]
MAEAQERRDAAATNDRRRFLTGMLATAAGTAGFLQALSAQEAEIPLGVAESNLPLGKVYRPVVEEEIGEDHNVAR